MASPRTTGQRESWEKQEEPRAQGRLLCYVRVPLFDQAVFPQFAELYTADALGFTHAIIQVIPLLLYIYDFLITHDGG